ncbi:V-set and immunoglobulin domain-containing protein 4 [Sphaerodactylus townsendi]|uniref:V-set and immunoglobulin domain-containing protein 4 n=1 Tax=Sphaerodactylus townsendi TaxID=933632 RepID=UPI00202709CD|nr:V-set and immunoglobulin domain-containing protein 4 [Sphaerodactylus townsendi]
MKSRGGLGEALWRMENSVLLWLLALASSVCGKALLDLTGVQEIEGTWQASVNLPCVYEPSTDVEQQAVLWKISLPDQSTRTIFRRTPDSGDQTLLTLFKGRIHVPKDPPGDVSLLIEDLEMTDRGQYTCVVIWVARNKTRMTKERMTILSVVKVAVTKPVLTAGSVGSILPTGRNISLTCQANGSPPIIYRWFKTAQKGNADQIGEDAILHFDSLQESDTGAYFCEVQNRVSSIIQRSDTLQLTVRDPSELPTLKPSSENSDATIAERGLVPTALEPQRDESVSGHPVDTPAPPRPSLPLYIIGLIAVLCITVLLAVLAVIFCSRKRRADDAYEVTYNNSVTVVREEARPAVAEAPACTAEPVSPRGESSYAVEPAKVPIYVPMGTKIDNEYETLVDKMESVYEVVDTQKGAGLDTKRPSQ